jgi:DNA topoisomerase-1
MNNLLIVESPGKIKKLRTILKDGWTIAASVGHVRDLPLKETGVGPPDFLPRYEPTLRGREILEKLSRLVNQADEIFLATDPDREGEAIAWHLKEALNLSNPSRVTYTEITEKAVKTAMSSPRSINMNLVKAQEGRRVLDRLYGYAVSPAVKSVSGQNLTAGRVQSPALRLVVEREAAIRAFSSVNHFGAELIFGGQSPEDPTWKAVWNPKNFLPSGQERILDKELAQRVASLRKVKIDSYEEGQSSQAPPPPFITSSLQQAASAGLKFDPKKTMALAQRLYEAGHITYMRTDSPSMSEEAVTEIRKLATEKGWSIPEKPPVHKSRDGAQEAHEAIRPTHVNTEEAGETADEKALYRLIRKRAIMSQLSEARFATSKAEMHSNLEDKAVIFEAKGRKLTSLGWKVLLTPEEAKNSDKDEDLSNPVPALTPNDELEAINGELKVKKTIPPPRYTQASLIRELERRGIGRPSTYAAILDNIVSRNYISVNPKRQLVATQTGENLVSYLAGNFGFLEYDFTKGMEEKLDDIAEGKAQYLPVVSEANDILEAELSSFAAQHGHACPECGGVLRHIEKAPEGHEAGYDIWMCTKEICRACFSNENGKPGSLLSRKAALSAVHSCPDCGRPLRHMLREDSPDKKGFNFWGCSSYPDCRKTFPDKDGSPDFDNPRGGTALSDEYICPDCGRPLRHMLREDSPDKKGFNFWGCSTFPDCRKTFPDKDGSPDFDNPRGGATLSDEYSCPDCGNPLRHMLREDSPDKKGFNFWGCSTFPDCRRTFADKDGAPDMGPASNHRCPECGKPLRHIVREASQSGKGYDFWGCTGFPDCSLTYRDDNGAPDLASARKPTPLSEHLCPDCGKPLRHNVREDSPERRGYNFWGCSGFPDCSLTYRDDNGTPDLASARKSTPLSEHLCPDCGKPLRHNVREDSPERRGYNFWGCSGFPTCRRTFNDKLGTPDLEMPRNDGPSSFSCPKCQSPLYRRKGFSQKTGDDYDFFSCSNRECASTFRTKDDAPDFDSAKANEPSGYLCPKCQNSLIRRKGISRKTGEDYDFYSCSNRECASTFRTKDDAPVFENDGFVSYDIEKKSHQKSDSEPNNSDASPGNPKNLVSL